MTGNKDRYDGELDAVAPLADEVDDNTIDDAHGGTVDAISNYAGNEGFVCTLTLECQKSCQPS